MKKTNKKQFTILLFVIAICFMGLKMDLKSTQLGYYRSEGYNFLFDLYSEPIERPLLIVNIPDVLRQAYQAQGVNVDTVQLDTADIKIWGPVIDVAHTPADRIYNVVFHPDVQRWRSSDADFNINLLGGLFVPDGVAPAGAPVPFNTFESVNVNKHDQIYYSPNNAQFQINPGRKVVSFWTAALSEDKSKTVIAFNMVIDDQALSASVAGILSDPTFSDKESLSQLEHILFNANLSPADHQAARNAATLIMQLEGIEQNLPEEYAAQGQEDDDAAELERVRRESEEQFARDEALKRQQEAAERARQDAQAETLRVQRESERIQREQQEAADRELAQRLADQESAQAEQARVQAEALRVQQEQEKIQREQQEAGQTSAQQGATQPAPVLSRAEAIERERAERRAKAQAIFGKK